MMNKKNIRIFRYISQGLGVLLTVLGLFTNYPMAKTILLGITFMIGPVFCGWLCPLGSLQDAFSWLGHKLEIKKKVMPAKVQKVLVVLRYIFMAVALLISADFVFTLFSYDPQSNLSTYLSGNSISILGWVIILIFAMISLVYERPFCNYLCIQGAEYGLIGAVRPITIIRNENSCISCGKCNKVCPMHIDIMEHQEVRSLQCINCLECVAACPVVNTLEIGVTTLAKKSKKVKTIISSFIFIAGISFIVFNMIDIDNNDLNNEVITDNNDLNNEVITDNNNLSDEVITDNNDLSDEVITDNNNLSDEVMEMEVQTQTNDVATYIDGTYSGKGLGFRGEMTVQVTITEGKITNVEVTENVEDRKWFNRAYATMVSRILENQSTDVDTVSGATYSSSGIIDGVKDALKDAMN